MQQLNIKCHDNLSGPKKKPLTKFFQSPADITDFLTLKRTLFQFAANRNVNSMDCG